MTTAPRAENPCAAVDFPDPMPPVRPTRSMSPSLSGALGLVGEAGREPAGGNRPPPGRRDAQDRLVLVEHRPTVLGPVGVLPGDVPEVLHEGLDRLRRVADLALAVDLHPRTTELVRE